MNINITTLDSAKSAEIMMLKCTNDAKNLLKISKQNKYDKVYIEHFNTILENVDKANKFVPAPRSIWQNLSLSYTWADWETRARLFDSILQHTSCLNKIIATSFFEMQASHECKELWHKYVFATVFTYRGAAKVLDLKLSDFPNIPIIYRGKYAVLENLLTEIATQKTNASSLMILEPILGSFHLNALWIRYHNGIFDILVLDSLKISLEKKDFCSFEFMSEIHKLFAKLNITGNLYIFDTQRLHHTDTCSSFVISDVLHIFKLKKYHNVDLFDVVKSSVTRTINYIPELSLHEFNKLPLPMMKLTQSKNILETYMKKHAFAIESVKFKTQETMAQNIGRYSFVSTYESQKLGREITSIVNNHANTKFVKNLLTLFSHCVPKYMEAKKCLVSLAESPSSPNLD